MPSSGQETNQSVERRVQLAIRSTLSGVLANAVLAGAKAIAGVTGNSYALIADAMESLLDIFYGLVVAGGLRVAAAAPDANHPYGHGKAEPLAGMVAAVGILAGAVGIAVESVRQILMENPPAPAPYTLIVLVAVIGVKELLFRRVLRVGEEVGSTAVQVDAWHHRSDALTSVAAFVGITTALLGGEGYEIADDWAALVACAVIAYNGIRLLAPTLGEIMDAAPPETIERSVRETARDVPRVLGLDVCHVRKMGLVFFVDLHVLVDRNMTVEAGHQVAHEVKDRIRAAEPRIRDVLVHIEPGNAHPESAGKQEP